MNTLPNQLVKTFKKKKTKKNNNIFRLERRTLWDFSESEGGCRDHVLEVGSKLIFNVVSFGLGFMAKYSVTRYCRRLSRRPAVFTDYGLLAPLLDVVELLGADEEGEGGTYRKDSHFTLYNIK